MHSRDRAALALTCFSLFFGAGNLIFPPYLALLAGDNLIPALLGFYLSAIGLPVAGLLAVARTEGAERLFSRVSPMFSAVFMTVIYLSIGPCLAIPRTASTSFEMVAALLPGSGGTAQLIYSVLFFLLAALIALKPEKLTRYLGKILCPALLLLIAIIFIGSLTALEDAPALQAAAMEKPFLTGFLDGYQTMDAVASLAFGVIIMLSVRSFGVKDQKAQLREECMASLLAGCLFIVIYTLIAITGRISSLYYPDSRNGAEVLQRITALVFGSKGSILLAAVFLLACLNTAIGLLSSVSEYFSKQFSFLSYRKWLLIFSIASMGLSNLGLDLILKLSLPLLQLLYPASIVLIVLALIPYFDRRNLSYRLTVLTALVFSAAGIFLPELFSFLPLSAYSLGWVLPSLIALVISLFFRSESIDGNSF